MGRYYSGDIAGKFWFGVQDSTDAENFGGKIDKYESYACCGCRYEYDILLDRGRDKEYCRNCYDSHEEHFEKVKDDGFEDLIVESESFDMVFDGDQLKEVEQHIVELNKSVLKFIKSFTMNAESDYDYDFEINDIYICKSHPFGDFNDLVSNRERALIARWCLAKQVRQCLIDNGRCIFNCDP
jgi:hypothetical protein